MNALDNEAVNAATVSLTDVYSQLSELHSALCTDSHLLQKLTLSRTHRHPMQAGCVPDRPQFTELSGR